LTTATSWSAHRGPGDHAQPELRAFRLLKLQAQEFLLPSVRDANGEVAGFRLYGALVADLHAQRIKEHDRVRRLQQPLLPRADFDERAIGGRRDQRGRDTSTP
jgi:hypothetical protein